MQTKTKQICGLIIIGFLIVLGSGAIADYYGILGTKTYQELSFFNLYFRMIDSETKQLIDKARVRCVKAGSNNVCTNRDSGRIGVVKASLPIYYKMTRSHFFELYKVVVPPQDPNIHVFFIHNDYLHINRAFNLEELIYGRVESEIEVEMPPRVWD